MTYRVLKIYQNNTKGVSKPTKTIKHTLLYKIHDKLFHKNCQK